MADRIEPSSHRGSSRPEALPLPRLDDSLDTLEVKLSALTKAVLSGQSVALVTHYAAKAANGSDATKQAIEQMPLEEKMAWKTYAKGTLQLPQIDWDTCTEPPPIAPVSLRTARRRAEALNRLYGTDKAHAGHSVWFVKHALFALPILKAMARVIGAERNLFSGQSGLDAIQMADLQTFNEILSVSGQVLEKLGYGTKPKSKSIGFAIVTLGRHRKAIQELLPGAGKKRKRSETGSDEGV